MKNKVYVFFIILILTLLLLYFLCYETKEQRRARLSDDVITFIDQIQTRKDLISIPAYCISSDESHEITHTNFQRFQRIHNHDQKAAIYAAYKNGDEIAVIMNDQMYANIIDHSIEDIITQTPNDWDILDLYTSSKGKMSPKKIGNYLYQQLDEDVNENVNENIAYIINRKGMEKMLFSPTSQRNRYGIYPGIMIPNPIADLKKDLSTLELSTEIINKHKSKLLSLKNKEKLKDLINNLKTHNEKVGFTCDIPCPVYYINMDKDTDRRNFMERQIEKMPNVHFTRITGFNGYAIENKRNDVIKHDHALIEFVNKYDEMSKSEIGCTMSHLIAIKKAYKNGDKIAMICEDDILFDTCTLIKPISEMIENAPKNWEILQLSSFTPKEIHEKSKNHPNTEYIRNNGKQRHYNTACYLINRNGMETILKMTSSIHRDNFFIINKNLNFPSSGTADTFIYEICVTYTILPVPFTVDNTDNDSTIHTDHTDEHIMYSINTLSKFNEIKETKMGDIPDIPTVWQYWENPPNKKMPAYIEFCINTVKKQCEIDNIRYICLSPQNLSLYFRNDDIPDEFYKLEKIAHRADYIRALALYVHGGLWLDVDCVCTGSLSELVECDNTDVTYFMFDKWAPNHKNYVPIGSIFSRKNSPFIKEWVDKSSLIIKNNIKNNTKFDWEDLGWNSIKPLLKKYKNEYNWKTKEYDGLNTCYPLPWNEWEKFFQKGDSKFLNRKFQPFVMLYNNVFFDWFKKLSTEEFNLFIKSDIVLADLFRKSL